MDAGFLDECTALLHESTGVVIPVYLPQTIDIRHGRALLGDTAAAYCAQVADPALVCLSVDGQEHGAHVARQVAAALGASCCVSPQNRGKLSATANGVRELRAQAEQKGNAARRLAYIAVVDQDGDHLANELLNFVRTAQHIVRHRGDPRVMVLGQRTSRHRPMGLLRGELEELADRVLLDALAYRAALDGRPLCLEHALFGAEFPDFHSGYKLFDTQTAIRVFLDPPQMAGVSDDAYYRHACEAVMAVEALQHGAYFGAVGRTTINEQPITTFGRLNLSRLVADQIVWPCRRLGVPLPFVEQWLANHVQCLLLHTLVPQGVEELARIRQLVVHAYDAEREPPPLLRPLFA